MYHVNLVKNHLGNDRIEAHFFDDPKQDTSVQRKIPLAAVR